MNNYKGYQKMYLKGLAHSMKPLIFIGQNGLTPAVVKATDEALDKNELIKVRFLDSKEKDVKKELIATLEKDTRSTMVGMIGHVAIFYRMHLDKEKRKIVVPKK